MDIKEYEKAVITLFKSQIATDEQWNSMARAVLEMSESDNSHIVESIDKIVDPDFIKYNS